MSRKNLALILVALLAASCSAKSNQSAVTSAPAQQEIKQVEGQQIVFFDYNSAKLNADASEVLDSKVLPELKKSASLKITVEGHCDERGSVAYNVKLGKKRAEAVKSYLVKNGVKSSAIKTVSYGKSRPLDFGHNEEAWAKNRRAVTIEVKK